MSSLNVITGFVDACGAHGLGHDSAANVTSLVVRSARTGRSWYRLTQAIARYTVQLGS
jgi:hypothetical protein